MRRNGDEELRDLERRAAAGDLAARAQLRRARLRRGLPDPTFRGALRLARRARRLSDSDDFVGWAIREGARLGLGLWEDRSYGVQAVSLIDAPFDASWNVWVAEDPTGNTQVDAVLAVEGQSVADREPSRALRQAVRMTGEVRLRDGTRDAGSGVLETEFGAEVAGSLVYVLRVLRNLVRFVEGRTA